MTAMMRSSSWTNHELAGLAGWKRKGEKKPTRSAERLPVDEAMHEPQHTEASFKALLEANAPPQCTINVDNEDCVDTLCFEGIEWGVVAIAIERQRTRRGRVTGAVANQAHRRLFIHGPGLPQWGIALQLLRSGFRQAIYRLEEVFRKTGVPFNPNVHSVPGFDLPITALLKRVKPVVDLPRCQHSTESILSLVKKYAEARVDTSPGQLRVHKDHLKREGVGIDNEGRQWFTNDGRKGSVPWVDVGDSPASSPTSAILVSPPPFFAAKKYDHLGDLADSPSSSPLSGKSRRKKRVPRQSTPQTTPSEAPSHDASSRSMSGPTVARRSFTPHDHRRVSISPAKKTRPASTSPPPVPRLRGSLSLEPMSGSSVTGLSTASTKRSSVRNEHYDIQTLTEDACALAPAALVAPCVMHIPAGQVVTVEHECTFKPLRIMLQQGGRVIFNEIPSDI
eukprot:TRINITY_DN21074_c0_g5_i1.p1 TRINITY_DN21074_c0_g5~~TRINITY_DN21074_c0_g5_i1.p1  ORF type:complete len:450 (+),score=132.96 TRINITY_DN21074_c0_g5_i1:144-1493(+)